MATLTECVFDVYAVRAKQGEKQPINIGRVETAQDKAVNHVKGKALRLSADNIKFLKVVTGFRRTIHRTFKPLEGEKRTVMLSF